MGMPMHSDTTSHDALKHLMTSPCEILDRPTSSVRRSNRTCFTLFLDRRRRVLCWMGPPSLDNTAETLSSLSSTPALRVHAEGSDLLSGSPVVITVSFKLGSTEG